MPGPKKKNVSFISLSDLINRYKNKLYTVLKIQVLEYFVFITKSVRDFLVQYHPFLIQLLRHHKPEFSRAF